MHDVIAMERAALDRWGKGDPSGYLEIMSTEITYFDPVQEKRIDGVDAMRAMLAPLVGRIRVDRYDMIDPQVQQHGDVALLTFNLVSYRTQPDGSEVAISQWNATEIYARVAGRWAIVHSHWSYIKPEISGKVEEVEKVEEVKV